MSVSVSLNGVSYTIPNGQETSWGAQLTAFLQAVGSSTLQKSGGTFTLTADANFGATYGLKAAYFSSRTTNPASTGIVRLANASDAVSWRNAANGANLPLTVSASDRLQFNAVNVPTISSTDTLTNKTLTTPTITDEAWSALTYSNSWVNFGSTSPVAGYRKLSNGNVQLRGAIKNGTTTDTTTAFTLPAGYRPTGKALFAVKGSTIGLFEVNTDGTVKVYTLSNATELSLEGIIFATT